MIALSAALLPLGDTFLIELCSDTFDCSFVAYSLGKSEEIAVAVAEERTPSASATVRLDRIVGTRSGQGPTGVS